MTHTSVYLSYFTVYFPDQPYCSEIHGIYKHSIMSYTMPQAQWSYHFLELSPLGIIKKETFKSTKHSYYSYQSLSAHVP